MQVRQLMTPWPHTVRRDETLVAAIERMVLHEVRQLPVIDSKGQIVGILSDRDVRVALGPESRDLALAHLEGDVLEDLVERWMTWGVASIQPTEDVAVACRVMAGLRVGSLPVVDEDDVVIGILSTTDILGAAADLFDELAD